MGTVFEHFFSLNADDFATACSSDCAYVRLGSPPLWSSYGQDPVEKSPERQQKKQGGGVVERVRGSGGSPSPISF